MADYKSDEQEIQEAVEAKYVMESPAFQRAVATIDARCIAEWRNAENMQDRERAHAQQAALAAVVRELRRQLTAGDLARGRL